MTKSAWVRWFGLALAVAVGAGLGWTQIERVAHGVGSGDTGSAPLAPVGGPWSLTDQTGRPVTERSFPGKVQVLFFGYRFCPDVCPTELQTIAQALDILKGAADGVQPLFVSVDPQRDTPDALAEYTALFDSRILGLTGTSEQIGAVAKAFRVYYAKVQIKGGGPDDYLMDHSAFVYLADRRGAFAGVVPAGSTAAALAERIRTLLNS